MHSARANQIRQSLKKGLFQNQKPSIVNVEQFNQHQLQTVTLYNNFEEIYCYKNSCLGQGAQSIVQKCYKRSEGRNHTYAVKIFRSGDPEIINTIRNSFKINRALNELNCVIKAIDLFINVTKEEIHFVMELCSYPTLEQILLTQQLSDTQQRNLIYQLALAVNAIHEKCVSHRDLKPDNILVNIKQDDVIIKLIDFGVSKKFLSKTKNGTYNIDMWTRTGTLYYQAPEIFEGGGYTEKIDIWSIGIIVCQIFCNQLPFQCDLILDTIELICNPQYNIEDLISFQKLDCLQQDILKRLLRKDPHKRLTSQEFKLHPWLHPEKWQCDISSMKSSSEQIIALQQSETQLQKESFCTSTIIKERQPEKKSSWNILTDHIYLYSSSKQLSIEQQHEPFNTIGYQGSVTQFHELLDDASQISQGSQACISEENDLTNYQTMGSILLN